MNTAEKHNDSDWPNCMINKAIRYAWRPIKNKVKIHISDRYYDHDTHVISGEKVFTEENFDWDATAFPELFTIYVHLAHNNNYPMVWWVNSEFTESYQRGMVFFSPIEYFVYSFAHELSHIWQYENPNTKKWLGAGFPDADYEMDADLYATIKLNEYRRKTKFRDYNKR